MNRTKQIWVSGKEVAGDTQYIDKDMYSQIAAFEFEGDLTIVGYECVNYGIRLILASEKGYRYYMSLAKFDEVIRNQKIKITGKFGFFQQGTVQSIGLI